MTSERSMGPFREFCELLSQRSVGPDDHPRLKRLQRTLGLTDTQRRAIQEGVRIHGAAAIARAKETGIMFRVERDAIR